MLCTRNAQQFSGKEEEEEENMKRTIGTSSICCFSIMHVGHVLFCLHKV